MPAVLDGLRARYVASITNDATDHSGHGITGVYAGGMGTVSNTDSGGTYAYQFDGTNDWITCGGVSDFSYIQNTGTFNISFWMKLDNTSQRQSIIGNTLATGTKGVVVLFENGAGAGTKSLRVWVSRGQNGSPVIEFRSPNNVITDTLWHHVSIQLSSGQSPEVFVDNVSQTLTIPKPYTALASGDSSAAMTLGRSNYSSSILLMGGLLDDVCFFSQTKTPADITALSAGRGYSPAPTPTTQSRNWWEQPSWLA